MAGRIATRHFRTRSGILKPSHTGAPCRPMVPGAADEELHSPVVECERQQHPAGGIKKSLNRCRHRRFENRPSCVDDGKIEMPEENERPAEQRRLPDGRVCRSQCVHPGHRFLDHPSEPRHRRFTAAQTPCDQLVEREVRLRRHCPKLFQLPSRLIQMSTQPLQILLDELRQLRKQHGPHDAQQAIEQTLAGGQQGANRLIPAHGGRIDQFPRRASLRRPARRVLSSCRAPARRAYSES
jgi:hypothetical protein